MFTQKVKDVFKSRSRSDSSTKIPENLERVSKLECNSANTNYLKSDSNTIYLNSETNANNLKCGNLNNENGSRKTNATLANDRNSYFRRGMSLKLTNRQNKRDGMTDTQNESFWKLKAATPRADFKDAFGGGLSNSDDLRKEEKIINESCLFCYSDSEVNRNTGGMIYDQESQLKRSSFQKLNLNNNGYNPVPWMNPKYNSCELTMCHYCLKQICVCGSNKLIPANNNNYLGRPIHHSNAENSSSWFSPVLQYAFGEERSQRNDFIILGLGIHQYIKEVFSALDSDNKGYVHYDDLQILCKILGKDLRSTNMNIKCEEEELNSDNICVSNSCELHLHFGKFSELVCRTFSDVNDSNSLEKRKNTQLVNATVNVTRRSESLNMIAKQLEELENDYLRYKRLSSSSLDSQGSKEKLINFKGKSKEKSSKDISYESNNNSNLENLKLQKIVLLQQQELQCLREVIEDLRISLQCSDAENLNLRVQEFKKHQKFSHTSLGDSSKNSSSSDDEKDSIDRLILNFPSSESVKMDSLSSILSMESLTLSPHSRSPLSRSPTLSEGSEVISEVRTKVQKTKLRQKENDNLSLDDEIQNVYQTLSETRLELEDTRHDLENTVSELRNKNSEILRLNKCLLGLKSDLKRSVTENKSLRDTIVTLKHDQQDKNTKISLLDNELEILKSNLAQKENEVVTLSDELQRLQTRRRKDLKQFSETRDLIFRSLLQAKKNENSVKEESRTNIFEKQDQELKSISENYSKRLQQTSSGSHFTKPSSKPHQQASLEPPMRRNYNCDKNNNEKFAFSKRSLIRGSNNCQEGGLKCDNDGSRLCGNGCRNCNVDDVNVDNCTNNAEQEKVLSQKANPSSFLRSCEFESSTNQFTSTKLVDQDFPVSKYENQKPIDNFPVTNNESYKRDVTSNSRKFSYLEVKPTLEVKPNLTTPIAIMRNLFSKPPQSPETFKSGNPNPIFHEHMDIKASTRKPNFVKIKNGSHGSRNHVKDACQTSTQILEGLEAEVDFLRKCLEEDQL